MRTVLQRCTKLLTLQPTPHSLWRAANCNRRHVLTGRSGTYERNMVEVRANLKRLVGAPSKWGESLKLPDVSEMSVLPESQASLPPRRMLESYEEAVIPLGSNPDIRSKYVNFFNTVRFGRLMEDLDTMGVWISYIHHLGKNPTQKCAFSIVTALVDSIQMDTAGIKPDSDIILRGHTTWVGNTSIEVTMNVDQENDGQWQKLMTAKFLMVTNNPAGTGKVYLCPLEVGTEEEKAMLQQGEANKAKRQLEKKESLLRTPPNQDERILIHELFTKTLDEKAATFKRPVKPVGAVWMEHTMLKNVHICFPQQRNLYNKIFGGFLMRHAFELAWANACLYCKSRPLAVAVDDIMFRKPVEVVYTEGSFMQIKVHAEVVNPKTTEHETTNIFHYTFRVPDGNAPEVMPKSYSEYMMFLDGKRHFDAGREK